MKKSKFLIILLSCAIMLMGAGYAAWTDQVIINNTVGTGELKVAFVDDDDFPIGIHSDFVDATVTQNDDLGSGASGEKYGSITTVTVDNMYPGSVMNYDLKIKNLGTIPAVINNCEVNFAADASDYLKNNVLVFAPVLLVHQDGTHEEKVLFSRLVNFESQLNELATWRMEPGDRIFFDSFEGWLNQVPDSIDGLEVDKTVLEGDNCIFFNLPITVGNALEGQSASFEFVLNYKQHNK